MESDWSLLTHLTLCSLRQLCPFKGEEGEKTHAEHLLCAGHIVGTLLFCAPSRWIFVRRQHSGMVQSQLPRFLPCTCGQVTFSLCHDSLLHELWTYESFYRASGSLNRNVRNGKCLAQCPANGQCAVDVRCCCLVCRWRKLSTEVFIRLPWSRT